MAYMPNMTINFLKTSIYFLKKPHIIVVNWQLVTSFISSELICPRSGFKRLV